MLFYADFFFFFQPREQEPFIFLSSTLDGPCCQQQKIGVFVFYVYIFGIRYAANFGHMSNMTFKLFLGLILPLMIAS